MNGERAGSLRLGVFSRSYRMSKADFDPEYVFSHHHATPEKLARYNAIHDAAKRFAQVLLDQVPESSDRSEALRLAREASMMACAAISLEGRLH
jgi:hypothetical protein